MITDGAQSFGARGPAGVIANLAVEAFLAKKQPKILKDENAMTEFEVKFALALRGHHQEATNNHDRPRVVPGRSPF
jgi:uncharacterized protein (DUF305 family)